MLRVDSSPFIRTGPALDVAGNSNDCLAESCAGRNRITSYVPEANLELRSKNRLDRSYSPGHASPMVFDTRQEKKPATLSSASLQPSLQKSRTLPPVPEPQQYGNQLVAESTQAPKTISNFSPNFAGYFSLVFTMEDVQPNARQGECTMPTDFAINGISLDQSAEPASSMPAEHTAGNDAATHTQSPG